MNETTNTIVLIHGLWMTPLCWEKWIAKYTELGYNVIAPSWPRMDRSIEEIRSDPAALEGLGVEEIVSHYEGIIGALPEAPIVMGHSFGGLFTQILVDRGFGLAGIAISPAAAKGVFLLPISTLKVSWPVLSNPANTKKASALTPEQFHYAFGNLLSESDSLEAYNRYAVPGTDHVLFQAGFANFNPNAATKVDFENSDRAPLLLIGGDKDHICPASVVEADFRLYKDSGALTEYKEFGNRSHNILLEEGWEEVADYAINWAVQAITPDGLALEVDEQPLAPLGD